MGIVNHVNTGGSFDCRDSPFLPAHGRQWPGSSWTVGVSAQISSSPVISAEGFPSYSLSSKGFIEPRLDEDRRGLRKSVGPPPHPPPRPGRSSSRKRERGSSSPSCSQSFPAFLPEQVWWWHARLELAQPVTDTGLEQSCRVGCCLHCSPP